MSASFFAFCCAVILFILACVLFTIAIINRKRNFFLGSTFVFFLFLIPTCFLGYKIIRALTPRSGMDAYVGFFGKPTSDCVKITNFQDAEVPVMDFAIAFRFKICSEELLRIVSQKEYERERISTNGLAPPSTGVVGTDEWLNPPSLGDTILRFRYTQDNRRGTTIYSNLTMTEAFCIDIIN